MLLAVASLQPQLELRHAKLIAAYKTSSVADTIHGIKDECISASRIELRARISKLKFQSAQHLHRKPLSPDES